QPHQSPFAVVVLGSLPGYVRLGSPRRDDWLIGRVLKIAPRASRTLILEDRRHPGQCTPRQVAAPQSGASREHDSPVLSLSFVHPEQTVLHGDVQGRSPQVRRATELAVPRMRELMRQQVTPLYHPIPLFEVAEPGSVLTRAVMLETDRTEGIADGQQEIVVIEVARAEQLGGFRNQFAMRGQRRGRNVELIGRVRYDIEIHRRL